MNKAWLSTLSTALVALSLGSGCELEQPADFPSQAELYGDVPDYRTFDGRDEDYPGVVLRSTRRTILAARVDDAGILGIGINIGRYQDAGDRSLRGHVFGQRVDLQVAEGRVSGFVSGTLAVDVSSTREQGTLHVRGLVRGRAAEYRLDEQRLSGTLGRCRYDLARSGDQHYQGEVHCDGQSHHVVRLKLPPELDRWTDPEVGAALGLLLGGA